MIVPNVAMAGPAASLTTMPTEIWDVETPRVEMSVPLSHRDVSLDYGFDGPETRIPMEIQIVTRADFDGAVSATEMWDHVSDDTSSKSVGVSHLDLQPGQSFDYSASQTANAHAAQPSGSSHTHTTPDA